MPTPGSAAPLFWKVRMHSTATHMALAAALLASLLAACDGKKEDFSNSAKNTGTTGKSGTAVIPPSSKSEMKPWERPSYAPPADPEIHRIDMVEFERQAYNTLRKFGVAQRAFINDINPMPVDLDGDGAGEYGFLLEIMGVSYLRTPGGLGRAPVHMSWPLFKAADAKEKAIIDKSSRDDMGFVKPKAQGGEEYLVSSAGAVFWVDEAGIAERAGYYFMFFLPGREKAVNAGALVPPGDPSTADALERRFAGIAWPKKHGVTGRRVFFSGKPEEVWSRWNLGPVCSGRETVPDVAAALDSAGPNPGNLDAEIASVESGKKPGDGGRWRFYGEKKDKKEFEWEWPKDREIEEYKADGGGDEPWMKGEDKRKKKSS